MSIWVYRHNFILFLFFLILNEGWLHLLMENGIIISILFWYYLLDMERMFSPFVFYWGEMTLF